MRPGDVRERLEKSPFEPFLIRVSDGQSYEVRHPLMFVLSRSTLYVGIVQPTARLIADRVAHVSLVYITRIEPANGHRTKGRSARS